MPPVALRPRSTTELIDASVQLLRQHYKELVTVTALFMIPAILIRLFVPFQPMVPGQLPNTSNLFGSLLALLVQVVLSAMSTAAVVVIVSDNYLGRDVSIGAAVSRVLERFWTVLAVAILQGFIIGFGFLLFIIPGFIFLGWYFAATNVVMVEGKSTGAAFSRSKFLAGGSVGRIVGTLVLAGVIVACIELLISLLLNAVASGVRNPTAAGLLPIILGIFIYPFATVVVTLLYYDLRIRKEGFDLELMAKELGFAAPAAKSA